MKPIFNQAVVLQWDQPGQINAPRCWVFLFLSFVFPWNPSKSGSQLSRDIEIQLAEAVRDLLKRHGTLTSSSTQVRWHPFTSRLWAERPKKTRGPCGAHKAADPERVTGISSGPLPLMAVFSSALRSHRVIDTVYSLSRTAALNLTLIVLNSLSNSAEMMNRFQLDSICTDYPVLSCACTVLAQLTWPNPLVGSTNQNTCDTCCFQIETF